VVQLGSGLSVVQQTVRKENITVAGTSLRKKNLSHKYVSENKKGAVEAGEARKKLEKKWKWGYPFRGLGPDVLTLGPRKKKRLAR